MARRGGVGRKPPTASPSVDSAEVTPVRSESHQGLRAVRSVPAVTGPCGGPFGLGKAGSFTPVPFFLIQEYLNFISFSSHVKLTLVNPKLLAGRVSAVSSIRHLCLTRIC